jgi:DUF4097 and DUF4098 domain-containing protein YvlB
MVLGTAALVYILAASPAGGEQRQARTPDTDQTVPVARGARLAIDNLAGEVVVHTWDRDSVRVQARHGSRTKINIRPGASSVTVTAESTNGPNGSVDYEITAPAWMAMKIEGPYNDVTIDGAQSEVSVETVRGDIHIKGGSGAITGRTIEGEVVVEGARGKVNVSSVNEGIKITGSSGEIVAETTNGSITLIDLASSSIDVTTINGDVTFDGSLADNGHYTFATHNGDIVLTVPEHSNATFNVRAYNGDLTTSLPFKGEPRPEARRGKRASYTLGTGSADVDVESFGGEITLRRAGAPKTGRRQ